MGVQCVNSILFVYEARQTRNYFCLSTFFSFCGVMTTGRRWKEEDRKENLDMACDLLVFMGVEPVEGVPKKCVFLPLLQADVCTDEKFLDQAISEITKHGNFSGEGLSAFEKIKEMYCAYGLRQVEYTSQFYFYVPSEMKQAFEVYYKACAELRKLQKKEGWQENPYLWYARGQFIRRMQNLSDVTDTEKIYDISSVLERLEEIFSENKKILSYYVLMGHLAETDDKCKVNAGKYYTNCVDLFKEYERKCPCMSPIYYSLGHWWEVQQDRRRAHKYYTHSFECDRYNYRALFKLARYEEQIENNYEKAWDSYSRIQEQLEDIESTGYIQPIENEYLCKVYFIKWSMIEAQKVVGNNKELKEKLLRLSERDFEETLFIKDFYGEDAEQYFEYMLERTKGFQKKL